MYVNMQYIQIDWGGGSYGHISQRAIKKTKQNHKRGQSQFSWPMELPLV